VYFFGLFFSSDAVEQVHFRLRALGLVKAPASRRTMTIFHFLYNKYGKKKSIAHILWPGRHTGQNI
jgi:hypothetical protein